MKSSKARLKKMRAYRRTREAMDPGLFLTYKKQKTMTRLQRDNYRMWTELGIVPDMRKI